MERVHLPEITGVGEIRLPGPAAHYLTRVLRLRPGDRFLAFDGRRFEWSARLKAAGAGSYAAVIESAAREEQAPAVETVVVQALIKGERMLSAIQKCCELGVEEILPVQSVRSVPVPRAERGRGDERRLLTAIEACRQSGRIRVPRILEPVEFANYLKDGGQPAGAGEVLSLIAVPGEHRGLSAVAREHPHPRRIEILIGPEGGFDPDEERAAITAGAAPFSMGPRILRSETAAAAALTLVQHLWGDMDGVRSR